MPSADDTLRQRDASSNERFARVQQRLRPIEPLLGDFATIYVTGSYGRREASRYSDLDVFLLSDTDEAKRPSLKHLDAIRIQAALIEAAASEGFTPFSNDGAYLSPHSLSDMIEKLGGPEDDYDNLFTARMLLLLESRPLLGQAMYERAIDRILDEYWRDHDQNADRFLPIYLTNDLIRYWKVLCLNYEFHTRDTKNLNKRRLDNYKLKHSRLLTCYSALVYFCYLLQDRRAITKDDAREMAKLTPTARLQRVRGNADVAGLVDEILELYVEFLDSTAAPKEELLARFDDPNYRGVRRASGRNFGDLIYRLLQKVGENTNLLRYLMV